MTKFSQSYPTDLKYSEWLLLEQFFPPAVRGRPRKWELWLIINAILYVTRTGCQWRMLPTNFPPWQTVYGYLWRWTRSGLWASINAMLVQQLGSFPLWRGETDLFKVLEAIYSAASSRARKYFTGDEN